MSQEKFGGRVKDRLSFGLFGSCKRAKRATKSPYALTLRGNISASAGAFKLRQKHVVDLTKLYKYS